MAIDIIKLSNNIRQLDGFINDITFKAVEQGMIVSQATALELNVFGTSHVRPTQDAKRLILQSEPHYELIYAHLEAIHFDENKELVRKMNELKVWQSKSRDEKVAGAKAAYNTYLSVLKMLSDGTMKNKHNQTPKAVATDGVKPHPNSPKPIPLPYMRRLFENKTNCIMPDAPVIKPAAMKQITAPVASTKRPTKSPVMAGIAMAMLQVCLLLVAVLLDALISSTFGMQHVAPFILKMPTISIVGAIIGAVSLAEAARVHRGNTAQPSKLVNPSLDKENIFERFVEKKNSTKQSVWLVSKKLKTPEQVEMKELESTKKTVLRLKDS